MLSFDGKSQIHEFLNVHSRKKKEIIEQIDNGKQDIKTGETIDSFEREVNDRHRDD